MEPGAVKKMLWSPGVSIFLSWNPGALHIRTRSPGALNRFGILATAKTLRQILMQAAYEKYRTRCRDLECVTKFQNKNKSRFISFSSVCEFYCFGVVYYINLSKE